MRGERREEGQGEGREERKESREQRAESREQRGEKCAKIDCSSASRNKMQCCFEYEPFYRYARFSDNNITSGLVILKGLCFVVMADESQGDVCVLKMGSLAALSSIP